MSFLGGGGIYEHQRALVIRIEARTLAMDLAAKNISILGLTSCSTFNIV